MDKESPGIDNVEAGTFDAMPGSQHRPAVVKYRLPSVNKWRRARLQRDQRRFGYALLVAVLVHVSLLALQLDGAGLGLPGIGALWHTRRIAAPELRVVLMPFAAPNGERKSPEQRGAATSQQVDPAGGSAQTATQSDALPEAMASNSERQREPAPGSSPPAPVPAPVAKEPSQEVPASSTPDVALLASSPAVPASAKPVEPEPVDLAEAQKKVEAARKQAEGQALERAAALRAEEDEIRKEAEHKEIALRQELALQEAARAEAARQELARQEDVRQEALRAEAARQEQARQEAARAEAARQELARQEAARKEIAARQELARQDAARAEAARQELAKQGSSRKEAIAPLAKPSPSLAAAPNAARRRTLWGRTDRDVALAMYAEGWRQKIEMNATLAPLQDLQGKTYDDPVVTVALRSDGSVEGVTFNHSSGQPEVDDAVRRIVQKLAPYSAFPPDLASEYDVVEIRRVWTFGAAVRLFAGGR